MVPYIGSFPGLETPIVVRYTSLIDAVSWNCIATYSDSYLDALTKARPTLAAPVAFHCWRIELDADGDLHELTFGRAGARISEQSENAAAVVVYL